MSVILRIKRGKTGIKSYYLDIHANGKRYKEYLGITLKPPKTAEDREENRQKKELAISVRAKKELELQASEYNITPSFVKNIDFVEYFKLFKDNYKHADNRIVNRAYEWFVNYLDTQQIKSIKVKKIDESLCKGYFNHLNNNLNGETPSNYFRKFKQVIRQAVKDKIITENPAEGIRVARNEGLKKEILSFEEIAKLAKAKCPNQEVKRAFLFSLYCGIRWCDVKELEYCNIDFSNLTLKYSQAKTKRTSSNSTVVVKLSPMLLKLIGEPKSPNDKIFNLPSHTGALKSLKVWTKNAEIKKKITWHCARHSFAVNQLGELKTDVKTVASLLGHSGLRHVEVYTRAIDEKKASAINAQPEVEFD